jgi:uncharacterized phage-like protein YoqJ
MPKLGGYNIPNPTYNACYSALVNALKFIKPEKAISGMALGFDQWAASACIELNIPFIAAVPFVGQESIWPDKSKIIYNDLLLKAEETIIVSEGGYEAWKMQTRNEWIVDNSEIVIGCWDGTGGGTHNCIDYALKKNKKVYRIDPSNNFKADWFG